MIYLRLFYEFFIAGLFAVGGGMATVPFLADMGVKTGWFTQSMLADMIAVSESTPGPIGVNMATYVGYTVAGIPGGIVATLGLVSPSFLIIMIVSAFLRAFRNNRYVERVFYSMRPASTAMIAAAGFTVLLLSVFNVEAYRTSGVLAELFSIKAIVLFVLIWLFTNVVKATKKLHPVVFIAFSAVIGILFKFAGA